MAEPSYLRDFRALVKSDPTFAELASLEGEIYGESDRVAAVMLGAMVEMSVRRLLLTKMREDLNSDDRQRLLDSDRAVLGTFSAKTITAYALKLIGPVSKHDLDLIRTIRNGFAHSRMPLEFTTPQVTAICDQLEVPDLPGSYVPRGYLERVPHNKLDEASDKKHPRTRFIVACHNLAYRMIVARTPKGELKDVAFADDPLP
jgi:hypothetical protein